ncbi:MAG: glycosyl transferase group 1 [uncultured bacterium]|nr:MAG: glycosyl transferase group 1 [uncultured bacterium]
MYAGKISKEKGVDFLLETFANFSGMKLYLAGELEDGFAVPKNSNIVNLGFVPTDQLNEYIRNSKCVVSASQLPETFGLIALEAMSHGKPFVGFNKGAYGEIITDGVDGFIVSSKKEFKKKLEQIAGNKMIFNESEIKERSKKYDDQTYLKEISNLFSEAVAKKVSDDKN